MTRAQNISDDLTRVGDIIVAARGLISDGQLINMAPLEDEIARICDDMGGLDAIEAGLIKPVLLGLIDDLDRLASEMRTRQSEYEDQLRALSTHGGAARAYSGAPKAPTGKGTK